MITPDEARALAQEGTQAHRDIMRQIIEQEIKDSATQGYNTCYIGRYVDDVIIKELREAGFKVKRDYNSWGSGLNILWED